MKHKIIVLFAVFIPIFLFAKNGSGDIIKGVRNLNEFDSIDLRGSGDVFITQGEKQEVIVEADDNIISNVQTIVKGKNLIIKLKPWTNPSLLNIYITIKEIKDLKISGSGSMQGMSKLNSNKLSIDVEGSGKIKIDTETNKLKIDIDGSGDADIITKTQAVVINISGSGDLRISGETSTCNIDIDGSGKVIGFDLAAKEVTIKQSGSGECEINAAQKLIVELQGSGNVLYMGNPEINCKISGSGTIKKAEIN